jgi:hypothetical protein
MLIRAIFSSQAVSLLAMFGASGKGKVRRTHPRSYGLAYPFVFAES